MERIKLTKDEKKTLFHVLNGAEGKPDNMTPLSYAYSVTTLQEKGLLLAIVERDAVINRKPTLKGVAYFEHNPGLKNPVDWKWTITTALVAQTALSTFLALFIACRMI